MRSLNFYTSCTSSKTVRVPRRFSLATVHTNALEARFDEWKNRLERSNFKKTTPIEFYSGGHWSAVRSLHFQAVDEGLPLRCRVVSAGYGLISVLEPICPYSATFASGQSESISRKKTDSPSESRRAWWDLLRCWKPTGIDGERFFRQTFEKDPNSVHLLALSPIYLDAVSEDLRECAKFLADQSHLIIVSATDRCHEELRRHLVPTTAQLQDCLGGPLMSLNVRLAAKLANCLLSKQLEPNRAMHYVQKLLAKCAPRPTFNRIASSDEDVSSFIRLALRSNLEASYSPLLRIFRKSGRACAMDRFRKIFVRTQLELHEKTNGKAYSENSRKRLRQPRRDNSSGHAT